MPDVSPSSSDTDEAQPVADAADAQVRAYFSGCRQRVDDLAAAHFGVIGTLRLHRAALGLDLLRAPLNVLLAPPHVLISLSALLAGRVGLDRTEGWLRRRTILLRTDVGREVEELVACELLELAPGAATVPASDVLPNRLLRTAVFDRLAAAALDADARRAFAQRMARAVRDYAGTRGAVAEATTALATLATGALLFGVLTPGVVSMAPRVAQAMSMDAAIARFPLGQTLGSLWYDAFPVQASGWLLVATLVALALTGAVFAAFAGIVADPVQLRLRIHRRRLHRLIDALEAEALGTLHGGFAAPEHYYARLFDLADAGASVLRMLRG